MAKKTKFAVMILAGVGVLISLLFSRYYGQSYEYFRAHPEAAIAKKKKCSAYYESSLFSGGFERFNIFENYNSCSDASKAVIENRAERLQPYVDQLKNLPVKEFYKVTEVCEPIRFKSDLCMAWQRVNSESFSENRGRLISKYSLEDFKLIFNSECVETVFNKSYCAFLNSAYEGKFNAVFLNEYKTNPEFFTIEKLQSMREEYLCNQKKQPSRGICKTLYMKIKNKK